MRSLLQKDKSFWMGIAATAVLFVMFFVFGYLPKLASIKELKKKTDNMGQQIDVTQTMLGDLSKLGPLLVQMQKELASFEDRLPSRKSISSIVSELSNLAKISYVKVISIKPQEPSPLVGEGNQPARMGKNILEEMKVELNLRGPYKATAEYIKNVQDSLNMLATIDEVCIKKDESIAPELDTKLVLTVYLVGKG